MEKQFELKIYNTATKSKEFFKPLKENNIGIYVCGMTVYDYAHLGHARAYTAFDVIFRFLKFLGYGVKYIRNITDIDDKIINRAKEEIADYVKDPKTACRSLSEKYAAAFHEDMRALKLKVPTVEPKATEHIKEIIKIIEGLIEKGHAYNIDGNVYFNVSSFQAYGKLSGRKIDEMELKSRIDEDKSKKNPLDFALWKKHVEGEPFWESPFGNGRPGWHIECSAMSMKYLGQNFDIHGGGQDLIFPHHENEMAQSSAFSGKDFTNYWIHNGFITINREKMSKSLKNFKTVRDLLKSFKPMQIKYYLLSTHYRSPLDFNDALIAGTDEGLQKIEDALSRAKLLLKQKSLLSSGIDEGQVSEGFIQAMCDDFNTPKALGEIFLACGELNKEMAQEGDPSKVSFQYWSLLKMLDLLGIEAETELIHTVPKTKWQEPDEKTLSLLNQPDKKLSSEEISSLVAARGHAKTVNNFALADSIRKFLISCNIEVRDQADGACWKQR